MKMFTTKNNTLAIRFVRKNVMDWEIYKLTKLTVSVVYHNSYVLVYFSVFFFPLFASTILSNAIYIYNIDVVCSNGAMFVPVHETIQYDYFINLHFFFAHYLFLYYIKKEERNKKEKKTIDIFR